MAEEAKGEGEPKIPEEKGGETLESIQKEGEGAGNGPEPEKKTDEHVPLAKYMEEKKGRKDAEAREAKLAEDMATLKNSMVHMTVEGVNAEVAKLAKEHDASPELIAQIISMARNVSKDEIKAELQKDFDSKLAPIEQERRREGMEKKFNDLYTKTLKEMPEYADIVNVEAIKALAFNPANAKKTLPQIIEEVYGNSVKGRKTLETTRSNRESEAPDFQNPTAEDFKKMENDPVAKEKWSKSAEDQIRRAI